MSTPIAINDGSDQRLGYCCACDCPIAIGEPLYSAGDDAGYPTCSRDCALSLRERIDDYESQMEREL